MVRSQPAPQSGMRSGDAPDRGDIIEINFEPQIGKEIEKRRPALVLSPKLYNQRSGLLLVCPITSQIKNGPFECPTRNSTVMGVVIADQLKSLDWRARRATYLADGGDDLLDEVIAKISPILGIE